MCNYVVCIKEAETIVVHVLIDYTVVVNKMFIEPYLPCDTLLQMTSTSTGSYIMVQSDSDSNIIEINDDSPDPVA